MSLLTLKSFYDTARSNTKNVYGAHTFNSIKQMDCLLRIVSMTPRSQKFELSIFISPPNRSYIQKYFSLSIRALVSLMKKIGVLESRDTVLLSNIGML